MAWDLFGKIEYMLFRVFDLKSPIKHYFGFGHIQFLLHLLMYLHTTGQLFYTDTLTFSGITVR